MFKKYINYILVTTFIILNLTGCSYKAEVKAGFEGENKLYVGMSEWPLDPIKIHIWKPDDIKDKCSGIFTKGYTSGGTIMDGGFHLKCIDGRKITGDWYSPSGQNNLVGIGKDQNGNKFHIIAGTQLKEYPRLNNDLIFKLQKNKIQETKKIDKNYKSKQIIKKNIDQLELGLKAYKLKNYKEAFDNFLISAKQNNSVAQYKLAVMYANGFYVKKSLVKSYSYAKLSMDKGYEKSKEFLAVLIKIMSKKQIESGNKFTISILR